MGIYVRIVCLTQLNYFSTSNSLCGELINHWFAASNKNNCGLFDVSDFLDVHLVSYIVVLNVSMHLQYFIILFLSPSDEFVLCNEYNFGVAHKIQPGNISRFPPPFVLCAIRIWEFLIGNHWLQSNVYLHYVMICCPILLHNI